MRFLFTDRFGGVSRFPFASLNVAYHVGDRPEDVAINRERLREKIGAEKLVLMEQVHQNSVERIETGLETPVCDAMITNQKGIGLCVMVADCIPVLLYDALTQSIGVAHAGREGVRLGVVQACALAMQKAYGTKFEDLHVRLGPSIHACCYEVGSEVTHGFERHLYRREGRYFLDLQRALQEALNALGMLTCNIEISTECSCCNLDYFSYRREKQTGRFAGVICL